MDFENFSPNWDLLGSNLGSKWSNVATLVPFEPGLLVKSRILVHLEITGRNHLSLLW